MKDILCRSHISPWGSLVLTHKYTHRCLQSRMMPFSDCNVASSSSGIATHVCLLRCSSCYLCTTLNIKIKIPMRWSWCFQRSGNGLGMSHHVVLASFFFPHPWFFPNMWGCCSSFIAPNVQTGRLLCLEKVFIQRST